MRCTYYRRGDVFGWYYDMAAGEVVAPHSHERPMYHTIECVTGLVEVNGRLLFPGDKITIDSDVEHSITALGPARVLNLLLEGCGAFTYLDGESFEE